jgi:adenosylmethionine-8-amino-7-oxononanoate aminotransferase
LTAISTTLPPVTAGPMLLKESPESEIFFSESGSELVCARVKVKIENKKIETVDENNLLIVMT